MEIKTRQVGPYKDVTFEIGEVKVGLGLLNQEEITNLVSELDKGIFDLDGSRYCKETSEIIQADILTCVDGFMETMDGPPNMDLEAMKTALCQIIVDRRK